MKHRIRAAAIIIKDEKMLLVKHVDPKTGFAWWVPPGGGVEPVDESVIACAQREAFEEAGLCISANSEPMFLREFYDAGSDTLNIEIFFEAQVDSGEITIENIRGNGADEHFIKDVSWCNLEEIQEITVFPEVLKDNFGRNEKSIYLGRQN